jgi:hypothetical protein
MDQMDTKFTLYSQIPLEKPGMTGGPWGSKKLDYYIF